MSQQQQTTLRVKVNNASSTTGITQYEILDLYTSIPILVSRSYAELQNISQRNSDYTYNIQIPGSKKNNRFFEEFYNVDMQSLYFNVNQQVACDVLINDEVYFKGYLRLNKINVLNSKVEYDVTLYSVVGSLFGNIGNGLLNELDFDDEEYTFNHTFNQGAVTAEWNTSNFGVNGEQPVPYFYPVVHNGYLYTGNSVNTSGGTISERTHLYTSTSPIGSFLSLSSLTGQTGYKQYRINSPTQGLFDNQLKPALSVWNLIKLMFKTYGYSIKSDFFNTPWMKSLYMYGYYSSSETKFSYTISQIPSLGLESVDLVKKARTSGGKNYIDFFVCKKNTGIPCYCASVIQLTVLFGLPYDPYEIPYYVDLAIQPNTTGTTIENVYPYFYSVVNSDVPISTKTLQYFPKKVGETVPFIDGEQVKFAEVIDVNLKQIDFLSSIAKKFNLVFVPSPDNEKEIIIEPYNYYIGTGDVWDWTDKLSFDKGFSVEPALNYVDSNLIFTDSEDTDYGNEQFKRQNKTIYGQMFVYNQTTNFKSTTGQTTTIFSPEVVRQWDTIENEPSGKILLPLGINYAGSSNTTGDFGSEITNYIYTGIKSKPKLMFYLGAQNVFLDTLGEVYNNTYQFRTYQILLLNSDGTSPLIGGGSDNLPIVSHTMPMGLDDQYKINNDSASILFNSEPPIQVGTVKTYNCYTENDAYTLFYGNRINNLQSPNTRFLTGKFYLKLSDYKNLKPNDLIKINDQYFTWNKINGYNLTDTELTEVELVQANNNPNTYPTRYFKYQYCDQTGYTFKLKTDFTNPSLLDTNFGWSVTYDHNMGTIFNATGTTPSMLTGYTSMFADTGADPGQIYYVPYTTNEISEDEYNNAGYYDWHYDTLRNHIWALPGQPVYGGSMPTYWLNSGFTQTGLNLYTGCTSCYSAITTYHILTGSSQHYGPPVLPSPTPTPTVTGTNIPTPTPTSTPGATPSPTPTKSPAALTPTPTPTAPNECIWSQDNYKWNNNPNVWGSCSPVQLTPTPTPTLTTTPTSTPLTPIYSYKLGTGTTSTEACNDYDPPLNNYYYSYCPPSGFTNGCTLYKTNGYPLTDLADNGYYANSGYTWFVVSGVMEGQSVCTYTPTPTPTPTQLGEPFGLYTGATYSTSGATCSADGEHIYTGITNVYLGPSDTPSVGDYFYTNQYLSPTSIFSGNTNWYIVKQATPSLVIYACQIGSTGEITGVVNCTSLPTPTPTPTQTPNASPSPTPSITPTNTITPSPTSTPLTPIYSYKLGTGVTQYDACLNYDPDNSNTYWSYCPPSGFTNGCQLYTVGDYPLSGTPPNGYYANSGYTWYVTSGTLAGESMCVYTPTPTPTPTKPSVGVGIYTGGTFSSVGLTCSDTHYPNGTVYIANGDTLSNDDVLYKEPALINNFVGNDNYYRLYFNGDFYGGRVSSLGIVSSLAPCNITPTPTPTPTQTSSTPTPTPTGTIKTTPTMTPSPTATSGGTGTIEYIVTGTSTSNQIVYSYNFNYIFNQNSQGADFGYKLNVTSPWSFSLGTQSIPSGWFTGSNDITVTSYCDDNTQLVTYQASRIGYLYKNNVLIQTTAPQSWPTIGVVGVTFTGVTVNNNDNLKVVIGDYFYPGVYSFKLGTGATSTDACIDYNPSVNTTYYANNDFITNGVRLYTSNTNPLSGTPPNGYYAGDAYGQGAIKQWYLSSGIVVGITGCTYTPTPTPTPTALGVGFGIYTGATYSSSGTTCSAGTYPNGTVYLTAGDTVPSVGDYFYLDQYTTSGNTFVGNSSWYRILRGSTYYAVVISSGGQVTSVATCP